MSEAVAQAVADNLADLGLVSEIPAGHDLVLIPFREDELVLLVPPEHPLALRRRIDFREALDFDFIGLHSDSALHSRLLRAAADVERVLQLKIRVTSFDAVCAMVAAGLGIGVVPRATTTPYAVSPGLVPLGLNDDWARRRLHVCVRSMEGLSAAARLLLDHLVATGA